MPLCLTLRVVLPPMLGKQHHRPHVPALQQLCRVGLGLLEVSWGRSTLCSTLTCCLPHAPATQQ